VQTAGFAELDAFEETFTFEFEDELHWWEWVQSQTQGHLVSRLGSGAAELRAAALDVVRGFHPIDLQQTVRFVTALAPDH
jgi:hypothetical protein